MLPSVSQLTLQDTPSDVDQLVKKFREHGFVVELNKGSSIGVGTKYTLNILPSGQKTRMPTYIKHTNHRKKNNGPTATIRFGDNTALILRKNDTYGKPFKNFAFVTQPKRSKLNEKTTPEFLQVPEGIKYELDEEGGRSDPLEIFEPSTPELLIPVIEIQYDLDGEGERYEPIQISSIEELIKIWNDFDSIEGYSDDHKDTDDSNNSGA